MPLHEPLAKAGDHVSADHFVGGRNWNHSVAKLDDQERLRLGGARISIAGGTVHYVPELTQEALGRIRFGSLPAATGHEGRFGGFVQPGTPGWNKFMATRKVVERPNLNGPGGVVCVTSNLGDKINANELVDEPVLSRYDAEGVVKKRKYQLAQVLTDSFVQDKFLLSASLMASVKLLAVSDADAAAARLQEAMDSALPEVKVTVSAGPYSRTRNWARSSIAQNTAQFSPTSATVDAMVIGKKLFLYGWETLGERWSVSGPLAYSSEVYDVHKAVCNCGTSAPMFALGSECTILGIDIYNGFTHESPSVEYHIGNPIQSLLPRTSSPVTSGMLSVTGQVAIAAMALKLEPILSSEGVTVATCVRVSRGYALINSHVLEANPGLTILGQPVSTVRLLARDLWLVKCAGGDEVAWPLREARPGEEVIVCYRAGDSVQYTSPITVRNSDGTMLVMSRDSSLLPGMSGGAIIALRDMALLGVYEGSGSTQAIGAVFSQAHFTDIYSAEEMESEGRSAASALGNDTVYRKMKHRGLGRYADCVMISVMPIYTAAGEHVGLGFNAGGVFRTTMNPEVGPLRVGSAEASPAVFESSPPFSFETPMAVGSVSGPMIYRKPNYFEKVVIVGRDSEGPYFSKTTRVVHVGVGAKNFVVEDVDDPGALPLAGGLVMSLADCAVLGQFVRSTVTAGMGKGVFCHTVEEPMAREPVKVSLESAVSRAFPMLRATLWPAGLLEEVFTHASCQGYEVCPRTFNSGMLPLAQLGQAAVKLAATRSMRDAAVPVDRWTGFFRSRLGTEGYLKIAEDSGLGVHVRMGSGTAEPPPGSKIFAEMIQALAGAVHEIETDEIFDKFCAALNFLYTSLEDEENVSDGRESIDSG